MNLSRRNFFGLFGAAAVAAALPMSLKALVGTAPAPAIKLDDQASMALLYELLRTASGRAKMASALTTSINRRLDNRRRPFFGPSLPLALKPGEEIPYEYALWPTTYIYEANTNIWDIKCRRLDLVQDSLETAMNHLIANEQGMYADFAKRGMACVPMPVEVASCDNIDLRQFGFHLRQQYAIRD